MPKIEICKGKCSSLYFVTSSFLAQYTNGISNESNNMTVVLSPKYSWILKYIFNKDHVLPIRQSEDLTTDKVLLLIDTHFRYVTERIEVEDEKQVEQLLTYLIVPRHNTPKSIIYNKKTPINFGTCFNGINFGYPIGLTQETTRMS